MPLPSDVIVTPRATETANERFKRRAALWEWNALVLAVMMHAAVLLTWPAMTSAVEERGTEEMQILAPPEVEIPPAPPQLTRPAMPVIGSPDLPIDATVPSTDWQDWPPERLAPPTRSPAVARETYVQFVPTMIAPRVLNQDEVERALLRHYPPLLRDAGIGGQVEVMLWLDERGGIVRSEVARTSGHTALDAASLRVVDVMRLSPALNHDKPARVIVVIPIVFRAR